MSLIVNLRHLETKAVHIQGERPMNQLEIENIDELIQVIDPVQFDLWIEKLRESVLVHGQLRLNLQCECVRCLARFPNLVEIMDWNCVLLLEGEEKVRIENDCVDLTPFVREDILLAFPRHPLCKPECSGLPFASQQYQKVSEANASGAVSSAWDQLDKLKL